MNGVLGEGSARHIAQWRSIKHIDETVEFDGEVKIVKKSERFSTELACVYEDGRVFLLTETPKDNPEITYRGLASPQHLLDGEARGGPYSLR
jgi:hypothetical protein